MKWLRYGGRGAERPGILGPGGRVRDLAGVVPDIAGAVLAPETLARLAALGPESLPQEQGAPQAELRLGPCVGAVGKFVCIGRSDADHAAQSGLPVPTEPIVFNTWTSAICGPDDGIELPRGSRKTDREVALGEVIGQGGRDISRAQALAHVAGYCVLDDVSERACQIARGGTWDKGKGRDSFGPIGPWRVTPDEVPDPQALRLWREVDGVTRQNGRTATMVFGVAEIVARVGQFMPLQPGDVIATGTPPGVGMGQEPPVCPRAGQTLRLGIDGRGSQTQRVRDA